LLLQLTATVPGVSTATLIFLIIGTLGIVIAATAILGGDLLDLTDGFVSTELLAGLLGGFGFGAAIANELIGDDTGMAVVLALGVIAAVPVSLLSWLIVNRLGNMRTDATPTRADLVGTRGVVVTPIPAGGYGEVRVRIGGQPVKLNARADRPLGLGAQVKVVEATSDTSVIVQQTAPLT
jgi:membrane protein implicated in regulation of membrane protease activity